MIRGIAVPTMVWSSAARSRVSMMRAAVEVQGQVAERALAQPVEPEEQRQPALAEPVALQPAVHLVAETLRSHPQRGEGLPGQPIRGGLAIEEFADPTVVKKAVRAA